MNLIINSLTNQSESNLNSSTRLFNVASKFSNLTTKHLASAGISSGYRHSKGEFQLFKLMTTFKEVLAVARGHFASGYEVGG
jgi:hypothetical protein